MISVRNALFIAVGLLSTAQISQAQNVAVIGSPESFGQAKDLTKVVETNCTQIDRHQIGTNVTLEIWHDRASVKLVQMITPQLIAAVSKTVELLQPTKSANIKIYLAKVDRAPVTYKVANPSKTTFVLPIVYDDKTDLNLDCKSLTKLCETIYTIPHELTHHFVEAKFAVNARWLEEGLGEYVSGFVGSQLSPRQAWKREMETLPEVSLNSEEIRNRLLRWNYTPETMTEESVLFYGASHQMIRLIIAEPEKQGEKAPLKKIVAAAESHGGSFTSKEVLTLLNKELKVDVTKLGVLGPQRKTEIFEAAKGTYLRERYNPKTGYRYTSLNTFAYLGETLTDQFLIALIEEVFDEKNTTLFQRLSAKALLLRLDQPTFDRLSPSAELRRTKLTKYKSLGAFRKFLQGLSTKQA